MILQSRVPGFLPWYLRRIVLAPLARGWPLLLICLLWAGVSLGCVSISYLTEVIRREDGSHGVDLVVEIAMDPGVMQHLPESDPADQQDTIAEQAALGWDCEYLDQGSRFVCRRSFASPEEFNEQSIAALQTFFDSEGETVIAGEISVSVATTADGDTEYEVTYVALVPDPDATGACNDQDNQSIGILFCDSFNQLLAQSIVADMEELGLEPALEQAILDADPPTFVFGVRLPDPVTDTYVNGAPGGESVALNEVRFMLTSEDAGAFTFQAFGQAADLPSSQAESDTADAGDTTAAEEGNFSGLATSSLLDQTTLDQVKAIQDTQASSESKTDAQLLKDDLTTFLNEDWWPEATGDPAVQATLDVMVDAMYLASLRDGNGDLLFPSVHAGLTLNTQLLIQYHDTGDTSAANALMDLTALLVLQDLEH